MTPVEENIGRAFARLLEQLGSDASRRGYRGVWARFCAWLDVRDVAILDARPPHVSDYIAALRAGGSAKATTGHALSIIREVYAALVREELCARNPAREVKNPKVGAVPRTPWLTEAEVQKLLAWTPETWQERRDHLCLCLLFGLGWRRAEIARLAIDDFDFARKTVTGVVKGGKTITVGVPPWLLTRVAAWAAYAEINTGALLPRNAKRTDAISGATLYNIVRARAVFVDLPVARVTPHALRRTHITLSGARGVPLKTRQLAVGHTSQATTERYDHARDAAGAAPGAVFADLLSNNIEKKQP